MTWYTYRKIKNHNITVYANNNIIIYATLIEHLTSLWNNKENSDQQIQDSGTIKPRLIA